MELVKPKKPYDDKTEEAFERFAIMVTDGNVSEEKALSYITRTYGFEKGMEVLDIIRRNKGVV